MFKASVIRSLKSYIVFASACRSEEGVWAFAWTTSAARPAEPAGVAFSLRNVDAEILERGGGDERVHPVIDIHVCLSV